MKQQEFIVNTSRKSCAVNFIITTGGEATPVCIVGYDPLTPNTFYFKSRFRVTGREEITLNCPQSPIFLKIIIWSEGDMDFQVAATRLLPLSRPVVTDPVIIFIERFSRYCGIYRPGIFYGTGVPFIIDFRREIYRDNGTVHSTPARIAVDKPIVQVSQSKFNITSIPARVILLCHEYSHNYINYDQDNEAEADQNAKFIYGDLGYPHIEGMNAFADIMPDTDENYQRMLNLMNI